MKRNLAFLLLLLPTLALADEFKINDFSGGAYTYPSANKIPDNAAAYLQNVYSDIEQIAQERNGYIKRDATVLGGAKPAYGSWEFLDTSGNDWYITYSSRTFYKNTIGQTPTAFGLVATVDQIPDCAKNLGIIMCVNGTDNAWAFDGTSTGTISTAPLGTLIEPWRTRFAIGNIGGAKSTVRFSADGSSSTWTLGGNAGDPFQIQIGGANDGEYIRCLQGSYQDSMVIGRKYDLWAVDGFSQADVQTRNISRQVGCIEPRSVQEVDGQLVFLSARGLESMTDRSIQNISEPIRNVTDVLAKNTVNQRSNTQTTQSDFAAGTISPASMLSTSISPGSVVPSTIAVIVSSDDTQADFNAGTMTNVISTGIVGSLTLGFTGPEFTKISFYSGDTGDSLCDGSVSSGFLVSSTFQATSVTLRLKKVGSPQNADVEILNNVAGVPVGIISSATIQTSSLSTSYGDITATLPAVQLLAGFGYWVVLVQNGCDGSNVVDADTSASAPQPPGAKLGSADSLPTYMKFKVNGSSFASTGNIVSRTFDMGVTTASYLWNWGALTANKFLPGTSTITYQTQTSANAISFETLAPVAENAITTSTVQRYIRYKATFATNDVSTSPVLDNITLAAGPFVSTGGLFTSQIFSVGSLITAWGPVAISDTKSSGTITYQFGSTTTASIGAISNWTNIVNGGIPAVSTNPYAAFRSTFVATAAGANLALSDFQTTWNEGGIIPSPVSAVYDRRYWISFTTSSASAPVLDTVAVWQRNKSFTFFKGIHAGSFALWRDKLYFGNSDSTGYVYQFDVGSNDDGANISSIITTKSYDLGQFLREKDLSRIYVGYLGNTSFTGAFSLSYDLDRSGNNYSLGSATLAEGGNGQVAAKFPFPISNPLQGREIQYTLTKSGTDDRLKLYDFLTEFAIKRER